MHNIVVVAVLDARHDLMEEVSCLIRRQSPTGHYIIEQLSTRHKLHDHEDVRRCVDHFVSEE